MKKAKPKLKRTLKVYTKINFSIYGKPSVLPEIRLKGNWLREWGFECGDNVKIVKSGHAIMILNTINPLPIIRL